MLNRLVRYKYSLLNTIDTSRVTEVKSVVFKNISYIFNNGDLRCVIGDGTIANDSHKLYEALTKDIHIAEARSLFNTEHGTSDPMEDYYKHGAYMTGNSRNEG